MEIKRLSIVCAYQRLGELFRIMKNFIFVNLCNMHRNTDLFYVIFIIQQFDFSCNISIILMFGDDSYFATEHYIKSSLNYK